MNQSSGVDHRAGPPRGISDDPFYPHLIILAVLEFINSATSSAEGVIEQHRF